MSTALITGASRGLGKALAQVFAKKGFHLIMHSKSQSLPEVESHSALSHDHVEVKGDICSPTILEELRLTASLYSPINVLINNAGIYANELFEKMNYNQIREIINTNLLAPILLTRVVMPFLQENGVIINISSVAAAVGGNGEAVYAASKAGLSGFSKSLQFDATRNNVRVLNIQVGAMQTDMTKDRENFEDFIDPYEVAIAIYYEIRQFYSSLRTTELTIARRNY